MAGAELKERLSEMRGPESGAGQLVKTVGPLQLFGLSFGCIVGSGWLVVLGAWLGAAGPGGAILGFVGSAMIMLAIAACYAELGSRLPMAGGEIVYANESFGPRAAFLVGWFITLSMIAIAAFEGTALGWITGLLWPRSQGQTLYIVLGEPVKSGSLVLGLGGAFLFGSFNFSGVKSSSRLQMLVTSGFMVLAAAVVLAGLAHGNLRNLWPLFQTHGHRPLWAGILWMVGIGPFFLNGFQAAIQAIEERKGTASFKTVAHAMYAAIAFAACFYCCIVLASAMAMPWQSLVETPMAAVSAMERAWPGGYVARIVLLSAALSVLKTWNGMVYWASRLLVAQARAHFIPAIFGSVHPITGSPRGAVLFVIAANVAGIALGRGALIPIVTMGAICMSFSLVISCAALIQLRRRSKAPAPYEVPGGRKTIVFATVGAIAMAVFAFLSPLTEARAGIPIEWVILIAWGLMGALFWSVTRRSEISDGEK